MPHVHTGLTCYCNRVIPSSSYTTHMYTAYICTAWDLFSFLMIGVFFSFRFISVFFPPHIETLLLLFFSNIALYTYGFYLLSSRISFTFFILNKNAHTKNIHSVSCSLYVYESIECISRSVCLLFVLLFTIKIIGVICWCANRQLKIKVKKQQQQPPQ